MTYKVKEGDFLEYRGNGVKKSYHDFTIGKIYIVKKNCFGLYIMPDTNKYASTVVAYFKDYGFHLITTPPETIQHGGYNYTRGEPVVPEWVKDEAWIVDKETGEVFQLFICGNSSGVHGYTETSHGGVDLCDVDNVFRPFTNTDWKWGMWADYEGKRVFVITQRVSDGAVQISHEKFPFSCKWVDADLLTPSLPD